MAWHPLLPRDDFEATASQRLDFLRRFAEAAPELLPASPPREEYRAPPETDSSPPRAGNPARMATAAALTDAAEIAFLSDRTPEGRALVRSALDSLLAQPMELWPTPRVALLGAVSRRVITQLSYRGIWLSAARGFIYRPWMAEAGIADHTAATLLAAALASGEGPDRIELLTVTGRELDDFAALGFMTLVKAPETDLLPLFGFARDDDGGVDRLPPDKDQRELGWIAAVARVQDYAARVRTLRMDQTRWRQLRPRAPLLDWPLLTLFLGLRRSQGPDILDEWVERCGRSGLIRALATYLRDLANEIDGKAEQSAYVQPLPGPSSEDYAAPAHYQQMASS